MEEEAGIMAEYATPPPIQPLIRKFEWRARRRQAGAYGFFVLMLAGGWRCGMGLCPREGNYGQGPRPRASGKLPGTDTAVRGRGMKRRRVTTLDGWEVDVYDRDVDWLSSQFDF